MDRSSKPFIDTNQSDNQSIPGIESGNNENKDDHPENKFVYATPEIWDWAIAKYGKPNMNWDEEKINMVADDMWRTFYEKTESKQETDNKDVLKPGRRRFDDILDYIKEKYGLPDETWTDKQYRILDADVSKRFSILPYFEQGRIEFKLRDKSPGTVNEENKYGLLFATPEIWAWVMAKYGKANRNWDEQKANMITDDIWRTFYAKTKAKQEVIELSSDTDILDCSESEDIQSASPTEIESLNTEDDKDDSDEDEDEDDTDDEAVDDDDHSDVEDWTPKTVSKGATSCSRTSTKKKIVKRGEPVRHCILGLPNHKSKKECGFKRKMED